jgi:hypothetical protein
MRVYEDERPIRLGDPARPLTRLAADVPDATRKKRQVCRAHFYRAKLPLTKG